MNPGVQATMAILLCPRSHVLTDIWKGLIVTFTSF